jgi:hypothetical protein
MSFRHSRFLHRSFTLLFTFGDGDMPEFAFGDGDMPKPLINALIVSLKRVGLTPSTAVDVPETSPTCETAGRLKLGKCGKLVPCTVLKFVAIVFCGWIVAETRLVKRVELTPSTAVDVPETSPTCETAVWVKLGKCGKLVPCTVLKFVAIVFCGWIVAETRLVERMELTPSTAVEVPETSPTCETAGRLKLGKCGKLVPCTVLKFVAIVLCDCTVAETRLVERVELSQSMAVEAANLPPAGKHLRSISGMSQK